MAASWRLTFDDARLDPLILRPGEEMILGRAWFIQHGLSDDARLVSCISRQHVGFTVVPAATAAAGPSLTLRRITPNDVTLDGRSIRAGAQGTEVRDGAVLHLLTGALICTASREPPPPRDAAAAADGGFAAFSSSAAAAAPSASADEDGAIASAVAARASATADDVGDATQAQAEV